MSWGLNVPLVELAQKLVETRLRIERLRLAQRLQNLEGRVERRGLSTKGLRDLRKSLHQATPLYPDRVDRALVLPSKPVGIWRRKYLAVRQKPGSVF